MIQKYSASIRIGTAAMLLLLPLFAGCVKDGLEEGDVRSNNGELRISAKTGSVIDEEGTKSSGEPEIIELKSADGTVTVPMAVFVSDTKDDWPHDTKGQLINGNKYGDYRPLALQESLGTFTLYGFNGADSFFDTGDNTATWDEEASRWKMGRPYYWPNETILDFYAYANMPASTVAYVTPKHSERKQMLHYEVPGRTDDQTDIILGVYEGTGNATGEAEINFYHPLTAVRFKRDPNATDLEGTISITMENVYYIGEVDQSLDNPEIFEWELISAGQSVTQDNHGLPLIVHGGIDGDPFLLIPQEVSSTARVLLSVTLLINGHKIPLNAVINEANWEAGKTYTYVVGYTGGLKVELDETSPSEEVRENVIVKNTDVKVAYVRAMLLGYITDDTGGIKSMWVNDDGTNKGSFTVTDGEFGSTTTAWNTTGGTGGWIKGTDGFFYYRKPLQSANPSLGTDPDPDAITTPLFNRYSISNIGTNNHFQLDIAVQSVEYDADKDYVKATWGEYAAGLLE